MILTYHEIVEHPSQYAYAVTLSRMTEHVAYLLRRISGGLSPVPIMFDDGLISHRQLAAGVLENAGFRGTFFVTPKWTGQPGFMDIADLKELLAAGHDIQSHGWSHALLSECGPEVVRMELRRSKEVLEDWLGREVDAISVPGGAYNAAVLQAAAETGYRRAYISEPWFAARVCCGVLVSGRLMLRRSTTVEKLERLLATDGKLLSSERLAYASRRLARGIVGGSLYHYLWCRAMGADGSQLGSIK